MRTGQSRHPRTFLGASPLPGHSGPRRSFGHREDAARKERLRKFVQQNRREGYLVGDGLEGGRLATAVD